MITGYFYIQNIRLKKRLYSPVRTLSPLFNSAMVMVSPVSSKTLALVGKHGSPHWQHGDLKAKELQRLIQRPLQLTAGPGQQGDDLCFT